MKIFFFGIVANLIRNVLIFNFMPHQSGESSGQHGNI